MPRIFTDREEPARVRVCHICNEESPYQGKPFEHIRCLMNELMISLDEAEGLADHDYAGVQYCPKCESPHDAFDSCIGLAG